jgi:flavin reductase (DIM6/NTAB) family NADH-FMN oxidoreductase RutF
MERILLDITPAEHPHREIYKLLTAAIVPRPIAWVSTVNAAGQPNLAPFSYFNAVCEKPPTVLFCPSIRRSDGGSKDTYHNIVATGEFVINFVTDDLAEAMNITAVEAPPEVNEFERAGLTAAPGVTVNVPHVAETPIYFECKLRDIVTISEEPGGGYIVIGTVTHMHFDDSVYREGNTIDFSAYKPVGRMTGSGYVHTGDTFEMKRPPSEIRPSE